MSPAFPSWGADGQHNLIPRSVIGRLSLSFDLIHSICMVSSETRAYLG